MDVSVCGSEREFIVTYLPVGRKNPRDRFDGRFGIFYMDLDGRRELLVRDPVLPCNQAVPLVARKPAAVRPSVVDYRKKTGTYYMQDIYRGPGLDGIPRGAIKAMRVVTMDFRAAGVGDNRNDNALISTPVAVGNGSWDPKIVLGTTPVYEDGSAMFEVPARTPVYFQALDAHGHVVQTMRSWSTLQPGECASCVGCHENKNERDLSADSIAMQGAPALEPFMVPWLRLPAGNSTDPRPALHQLQRSPLLWRTSPPATPEGQPIRPKALLAGDHVDVLAKRRWATGTVDPATPALKGTPITGRSGTATVNWISARRARAAALSRRRRKAVDRDAPQRARE